MAYSREDCLRLGAAWTSIKKHNLMPPEAREIFFRNHWIPTLERNLPAGLPMHRFLLEHARRELARLEAKAAARAANKQ